MFKIYIIIAISVLFIINCLPTTIYAQTGDNTSINPNNVFNSVLDAFSGVFKVIWGVFKEIAQNVLLWLKNLWESYILSWSRQIWSRISPFLNKEWEIRKPLIEKELGKEKQEIKQDIPKTKETLESLWGRFMELIK